MTLAAAKPQGAASERFLSSPLHEVFRAVEAYAAATSGERRVIPLHVGEPGYAPPAEVPPAVQASFRNGGAAYCDAAGLRALRVRLAELANQLVPGGAVEPEQVVVTPGSTQALYAALTALAVPGDEVLLPAPYWPVYAQQCAALGLRMRFYRVAADGSIDLGELRRALGARTRVMLVNSPGNPSGAISKAPTLDALLEATAPWGTAILSDEAYADFAFHGVHLPLRAIELQRSAAERPRVWTVHTFSKTFALTGLRVGYLIAPDEQAAACVTRVQEASLVCPATPAQHGALAALEVREYCIDAARAHLECVRAAALPLLMAAGYLREPPAGGWYAMCRIPDWAEDAERFAALLLRQQQVGVASGIPFVSHARVEGWSTRDTERFVRVALCGPLEDVVEGARRMCAVAQESW